MASEKTRPSKPRVGDEAWFVEWVAELGWVDDEDHDQGCDPGKHKYKRRKVASKEEAVALAREVQPIAAGGYASYWPAEFVAYDEDDADLYPWAGYWKETADPEYYEGEE